MFAWLLAINTLNKSATNLFLQRNKCIYSVCNVWSVSYILCRRKGQCMQNHLLLVWFDWGDHSKIFGISPKVQLCTKVDTIEFLIITHLNKPILWFPVCVIQFVLHQVLVQLWTRWSHESCISQLYKMITILAVIFTGTVHLTKSAYVVPLLWNYLWCSEWSPQSSQLPPDSSIWSQEPVQSVEQRTAG